MVINCKSRFTQTGLNSRTYLRWGPKPPILLDENSLTHRIEYRYKRNPIIFLMLNYVSRHFLAYVSFAQFCDLTDKETIFGEGFVAAWVNRGKTNKAIFDSILDPVPFWNKGVKNGRTFYRWQWLRINRALVLFNQKVSENYEGSFLIHKHEILLNITNDMDSPCSHGISHVPH